MSIPSNICKDVYGMAHPIFKKTEDFLCELVVKGTIPGTKIDRPFGIVRFKPKLSPTELLDDWSNSVKSLMDILNKVIQLISISKAIQQSEIIYIHFC